MRTKESMITRYDVCDLGCKEVILGMQGVSEVILLYSVKWRVERDEDLRSSMNEREDAVIEFKI